MNDLQNCPCNQGYDNANYQLSELASGPDDFTRKLLLNTTSKASKCYVFTVMKT